MTDLKQVAEALEWLGFELVEIRYVDPHVGIGIRKPGDLMHGDVCLTREDVHNAPAVFLILDALEAKEIKVVLCSPPPGGEGYHVKLVNAPKGGHTEAEGKTRTDAVLAAAVAATEASSARTQEDK